MGLASITWISLPSILWSRTFQRGLSGGASPMPTCVRRSAMRQANRDPSKLLPYAQGRTKPSRQLFLGRAFATHPTPRSAETPFISRSSEATTGVLASALAHKWSTAISTFFLSPERR
jgi:hypothetical protein